MFLTRLARSGKNIRPAERYSGIIIRQFTRMEDLSSLES